MINIKTQLKTFCIITLTLTFFGIKTTFSQTLISPTNNATCISAEPTFLFDGTSGSTTLEILDCNMSGIGLSAYTPQSTFTLNVITDDLSGITYNPLTNTLFVVTNGGDPGSLYEAIYEVNLNGNIINTFNLIDMHESGNINNRFYDTEDIVHLYGRTFAVVEERKGKVAIIDLPTSSASIHYSDADIIQMPGSWDGTSNKGLEGVSYDPVANQLHIVKESFDKEYYIIDMPTVFPNNGSTTMEPYNLQSMAISEAAAVHYVGLTPGFGGTGVATNRLIVDEAGRKVVEVDANYLIIDELALPDFKYEGITMDNNGTIYMVQERNMIHVYTNSNPPGVIHSATVSGGSYVVPPNVLNESTEYCWRVKDNDGASAIYSFMTISGTVTICAGISDGGNDIEELHDGSMYMSSSDLELIYDSNAARLEQKIGLRYEDLGIPQGAIIESAYLQFTTDETSSGVVNLTIQGENSGDASPFTFANDNLSARSTTQAAVVWSPPNWSVIGERTSKQQTPDLKAILQEIVNRNDFDQNSAIAFVISGSGINKRVAKAYEGSPALAPELCITFTSEECEDHPIEMDISLWLQGPYDPANNNMEMSSNYHNVIPTEQPYNATPWNYIGTESVNMHTGNVVDWVLISFRKDVSLGSEVFKAAGLLYENGSIGFLEQYELPNDLIGESLYIVVDHRNHLVVMSHEPVPIQLIANTNGDEYGYINYDFRQQDSYHTSTTIGQKQLPNGSWSSLTGDMDGNYDINGADNSIRYSQSGIFAQYLEGDLNLNADVNGEDRGIWSSNSGFSSGVPK